MKYVVSERDRLKSKLDQLIPYTKKLEARLKAIEEVPDDHLKTNLYGRIIELVRSNQALTDRYNTILNENRKLRKRMKGINNMISIVAENCNE